ncbi:MAG: radical SAM protein, partial [Actinomycetota bacterium]
MGDVLLINPIVREWAEPNCVPSGIMYLSSVLREKGHQVDILDWNGHRYAQSELKEIVKANAGAYDLVGVGGIVTTYKPTKWVTSTIKKYHPHVPVIVGGPLATSVPEILFRDMEIDIVCIGEGELTILDLMDNLGDLSKVKGLAYRDGDEIRMNPPRELIRDLDSIPFPDYENLDTLEIYLKNPIGYLNRRKWVDGKPVGEIKSVNIVSARGCPFSCNFCYSKYLGSVYRVRSVKNVVDEMEYVIEKFGCGYIHFTDELSFTKQRIHEFCDELKRRGIKVIWGGAFRIDALDRESMERIREAGCRHIGCGIESFSPKILRAMNK